MNKQFPESTPHIIKAFIWSMQGIQSAFKQETAFRQEIFCMVFLLPLGLWVGRTAGEKAILAGVLFIVLITELLNSAVENVVNRVGVEYHPLSGRAKDMGSAAVFISLVNAVVVWVIILYDVYLG